MNGRGVELVIFDCDGVLVDTEPIGASVGAVVLTSLGWPITASEVMERFLGCSEEYFQEEVERHIGRTLSPGWTDEFAPLYDAAYATELAPVDGVVAVLDELDRLGIATCVASNGSHAKMRRTMGVTGLYERFAGRVFSAEDVAHGKPAPDVYLHAAAGMGAPPGRCVVVEDSPRGVQSALAAGMECIGFAALTPAERLARPGVTLCQTMREVMDALMAMSSRCAR